MTSPTDKELDSPYENPLLSPVEVHHVAFGKPPIGQRGYNEDEVDTFLDLVEEDILRYRGEIENLRRTITELQAQNKQLQTEVELAESQAPVSQERPGVDSDDSSVRAAKILELAQITAEGYETDARKYAESLVNEAQSQSQNILSNAQTQSEKLLDEARSEAGTILAEAEQTAVKQKDEVTAYVQNLREEAERNHHHVMTTITEQRNALENRINHLKVFENEYRTRLRDHIESHLETLKAYDDPQEQGSLE